MLPDIFLRTGKSKSIKSAQHSVFPPLTTLFWAAIG
jgi:hypothetical protein